MKLATVVSMARGGRLVLLRHIQNLAAGFERTGFLAAAARAGVLHLLDSGPTDGPTLARRLELPDDALAGLTAWLDVGVSVGELSCRNGRYALSGRLAHALAQPENDDLAALLEEVTNLHHRLVCDLPDLLRAGTRLTLADQSGQVIARSSRAFEELVREAIASVLPRRGPCRLLEIGCGSGTYVRFALEHNPDLVADALELQAEVAEQACANLAKWGVAARARVMVGDIRDHEIAAGYDLVTLHNNIYYFTQAERPALLARLAGCLRPGGRILLTTACPGGSPMIEVLNLWGVMTRDCGPLPRPEEMCTLLEEAGFAGVEARNLAAPLDRFYAFHGIRSAPAEVAAPRASGSAA